MITISHRAKGNTKHPSPAEQGWLSFSSLLPPPSTSQVSGSHLYGLHSKRPPNTLPREHATLVTRA